MSLVLYFLAGLLSINCIPHLVKGITGQTFMTPIKRVSSPYINVVYGFINIILALFVLGIASGQGGLTLPWDANLSGGNLLSFLAGGIFIALADANLFSNPNARLPWQKD